MIGGLEALVIVVGIMAAGMAPGVIGGFSAKRTVTYRKERSDGS